MLEHTPLTPLGVRREFQQAVAELRTDLDAFTPDESAALMACGYKMASNALDDQLPDLAHVWQPDKFAHWPFSNMLKEIESTARGTERREAVLTALQAGNKVKI